MRESTPYLLLLVLSLCVGALALAQEPVSYLPPARAVTVNASGERIDYRADGTCVSTVVVGRVSVPAVPLAAAECTQSRARARAQLGTALDAGALFP